MLDFKQKDELTPESGRQFLITYSAFNGLSGSLGMLATGHKSDKNFHRYKRQTLSAIQQANRHALVADGAKAKLATAAERRDKKKRKADDELLEDVKLQNKKIHEILQQRQCDK